MARARDFGRIASGRDRGVSFFDRGGGLGSPRSGSIIMRSLEQIAADLADAVDTALQDHEGFAPGEHEALRALLAEYNARIKCNTEAIDRR